MVCILLEVLLHWVGAGRVVVVLVVLGHVVLSRRHDVVGWLSVDGRSWQSRRTDERTNEAARCVYECDDGVVIGFDEMSSVKMTMDGMMFERVRSDLVGLLS